jgi:hypothetical protein
MSQEELLLRHSHLLFSLHASALETCLGSNNSKSLQKKQLLTPHLLIDPTQDSVYPDPYGTSYGVYKGPENCGGFAATNVISTSYSYNEADLTPFYENRQCHEYMKLGLQGITFLYSSGDYGVAGNGGQCIDTATGTYNNGSSGMFNPSFPGGCPCKWSLLGVLLSY